MNILIVNRHEPIPNIGGIERISLLLGKYFAKDGNCVRFLSMIKSEHELPAAISVDYFPNEDADAQENFKFLSEYISRYKIDVLINQYGSWGRESKLFLSDSRPVRISEIHSTPGLLLNFYYRKLL